MAYGIDNAKFEFRNAVQFAGRITEAERATLLVRDGIVDLRDIGSQKAAESIAAAELLVAQKALELDADISRLCLLRDSLKDLAGKKALEVAATPPTWRRG